MACKAQHEANVERIDSLPMGIALKLLEDMNFKHTQNQDNSAQVFQGASSALADSFNIMYEIIATQSKRTNQSSDSFI